MGERFESSRVGRLLLTALMVVAVVAVALWNLPAGRPRDAVLPVLRPLVLPVGLDQDWALFAPDPRAFTVGVLARLTYDDGRTREWTPPDRGHVLAPYRTYRWQKYVERLRADDYSGLWEPAARWLADELGPGVRQVQLVRTYRAAVRPGSRAARPAEQRFVFYTLTVP
ncbi:MAG: hypothetical protein JWR42_296 [Marmoricola sp.]|nr:hypothetical protein [Marmoricola sp.]